MLDQPSRRVRRKLEATGVQAFAVVTAVGRRGVTVTRGNDAITADSDVTVELRLRVEPRDEPSFELGTRLRFSPFAPPRVGQRLAVVFDPADHQQLMLDPAALGGTTLMSGGELGAVLSGVRSVRTAADDGRYAMSDQLRKRLGSSARVVEAASAPLPPEDPARLLARLAALHDRGVLSDEQFEAQKRRFVD
jgi:hypothetical protein